MWAKLQPYFQEERKKGVLAVDAKTPSTMLAHKPGYIDRDNEIVVGLQTDQPFKRAIFPYGGLRMVESGLKAAGFEADPQVHEAFTKYRKSHNDGVFDAYTPEIMGEISIGEKVSGQTLEEIEKGLPSGVQVTMVRKGGQNVVPSGNIALASGDALLVVAEEEAAIAEAATKLGKLQPGLLAKDRADLDYIRVFVGKANVVGVPLSRLPMPPGFPAHLLHVRRYDADLVPTPDLMLEFGDRVGVLMPPNRREEIRKHFGDTVKAAAEFSYVSLGIGMVLGVLLGLIPIPIPGIGTVTLGIGGGPLIVALILGKLRRTGPMLWTMPLPANIVLRNFGLAMFLATVGVNAGQPFVRTIAESGFTMFFIGIAVLLTTVVIVLLVGYYLLKIPYDDLVGVASGATGNPAILVYSTRMAPTERPDIGYAMIFPSMTIVKVIAVQIVGLLVGAAASAG